MEKILITALNLKNVIGRNNEIPWRLPLDFKRFKQETSGHSIIMGRVTYDSIISLNKRPLPGRTSIVVSSTLSSVDFENVKIARSFEEALSIANDLKSEKVFFGGGTEIYKAGLMCADKLMLTQVLGWHDGDTKFPSYNQEEWDLVFSETHVNEPGHTNDFVFLDLNRKK